MSALSARTILQYSLVSALRGSRLTENAKLQLVRLLHDFVTRQSGGAKAAVTVSHSASYALVACVLCLTRYMLQRIVRAARCMLLSVPPASHLIRQLCTA